MRPSYECIWTSGTNRVKRIKRTSIRVTTTIHGSGQGNDYGSVSIANLYPRLGLTVLWSRLWMTLRAV